MVEILAKLKHLSKSIRDIKTKKYEAIDGFKNTSNYALLTESIACRRIEVELCKEYDLMFNSVRDQLSFKDIQSIYQYFDFQTKYETVVENDPVEFFNLRS
jgi:hypothetical protein